MVLVTGATGFIGRHLVSYLRDEGIALYALTRTGMDLLPQDKKTKIIKGDITEILELPGDVKTIYHCAGAISEKSQMERVNVHGTKNIAELAHKGNCTLIYLSSAGVIGQNTDQFIDENTFCRPITPYEQSKFDAEKIVLEYASRGLKFQILRPTIIFGTGRAPSQDSFLQLIAAIKSGRYVNIGKGDGIYNVVHINEVVYAMRCLDRDQNIKNGQIFFINSPISFKHFAGIVRDEMTTNKKKIKNIPQSLALLAALGFSFVSIVTKKQTPLTLSRFKALTKKQIYSQNLLLQNTSYSPIKGIDAYVRQACHEYEAAGLLK